MKRHISGKDLRDKLLSKIKAAEDAAPTEENRIEALSSSGNRALLQIIVTKQPRSISELATLAGRLQPNVSRSLNSLARAGLLTIVPDGRTAVPALTEDGLRKAQELGFSNEPSALVDESVEQEKTPHVFSATIVQPIEADLTSDVVPAKVVTAFPSSEGRLPFTAHTNLDLNDLAINLLENWWRILYRRGDPFKLFPIERESDQGISHGVLFLACTGRLEVRARSATPDQAAWGLPRLGLSVDEFTSAVLSELVRPVVSLLRARRRFDRPVESLLRRTEEILANPVDLAFWRSAGAFGLSYQVLNDNAAADIANLMQWILNEDARLELVSALTHDQLRQAHLWVEEEISSKAQANTLPRLTELRRGTVVPTCSAEPWRIGTERAREARRQLGLAEDRSVGGLSGLGKILGGRGEFVASSPAEDLLRGFLGHGDSAPVIVVKDEGPRSTAFLMSRAVGDFLVYGNREAPVVDIYTDRQAVGRAFAAEFMAPARGVVRMIEEDDASLDAVAEHYGTVREVIRHQYENNVAQYLSA